MFEITTPTYTVNLLSNPTIEVKFRPFLVKEEKLLLMAAETKDPVEIINTVQNVLSNCILSDIDIKTLPFFDIDYLFIALRAKSIKETIDLDFICNNIVDDKKCGTPFNVTLDISNTKLKKNPSIGNKIELTPTKGIVMKYPTYGIMKWAISEKDEFKKKMNIIISCIDFMYDKDKTYSSKDMSREEIEAFIDGLTASNFEKIERWVDNLPTFHVHAEKDCPACKFHHNISYNNFDAFFL